MYSQIKSNLAAIAVGFLLACCWRLPADDKKPADPVKPQPMPVVPVKPTVAAPGAAKPSDAAKPTLGRTIRLEFKLAADDEHLFPVLCAGGDFAVIREIKETNGEHSVKIEGKLHSTEAKDRVLATYKIVVRHANFGEGAEASFTISGSAVLKLSKETKLGRVGEGVMSVKAIEEE